MPRREDERSRNLARKHPKACTCRDCNDRRLKKNEVKARGEAGVKLLGMDRVKRHPAGCECLSCKLLKSVNPL